MFAERKISLLAVVAFHAGNQRRTGHTVPDLYAGHALAYFYHITGKLVSQYDRVEMHTILKHSWDVGSADSGGFYFYLHSSRSHLRLLIIHITYVFICTYNCCFHLLICSFLP